MSLNEQSDIQISVRDTVEVVLYRTGITLFSFFLIASGLEAMRIMPLLGYYMIPAVAFAAVLSALTMHLYIKSLRWFIRLLSIFSLILYFFVWNEEYDLAALAGFYGVFAFLAWKEVFCFKIPGGTLAPFFLFPAIGMYWLDLYFIGGCCQLVGGMLYFIIALYKWEMPVSDDIGDKSLYQ